MIASVLATLFLLQSPALPQDQPVVTGPRAVEAQDEVMSTRPVGETVDALRLREAVAYGNDLPRGAPSADYPLVAWCEALVLGHVAVGESLTDADPLDLDIVRLGRLEAQDFRSALDTAAPRQSAQTRAAADAAAAEAAAKWEPILAQTDEGVRSEAFGLFFGLPGRCEHAARRIRENITTPPVTTAEVGLE